VGVTALSGVGLVIGLALTGHVTEALAVWGSLVALAGSASGFYFGRGGSSGDALPPIIDDGPQS
jgi:hypothetical protein